MPLQAQQQTRFFRVAGPVAVSIQNFTADGFLTWINVPTNATFTVQTAASLTVASNWVDYLQVPVTNGVTVHRIFDPNPPSGMVLVPAGSFTMGDTFSEGSTNERPTQTVYVAAFYMDRFEVTKALWDEVRVWANAHDYDLGNEGSGKAANHPVQTVSWYDVVKWCNARSEKEGKVPAYYYRSSARTTVYRRGELSVQYDWVILWDRGYRLPTEAEWEKAARGGLIGKRFAWGDTITHGQANYASASFYGYDISPTRGYHPTFAVGDRPYTSPVGSFAANGYGLYDMAGNVWEWCWDWFGSYSWGSLSDPRGPASGSDRVLRGGSCDSSAFNGRLAYRYSDWPDYAYRRPYGFRPVLSPGP